jgi:hypothetical protein
MCSTVLDLTDGQRAISEIKSNILICCCCQFGSGAEQYTMDGINNDRANLMGFGTGTCKTQLLIFFRFSSFYRTS